MSRQHGAASSAQARELGVDRRALQRLLRDGAIESPSPGVLIAGGSPVTFRRRAMAAALSPGVTAVSHRTAARLHALDGFETDEHHRRHRQPGRQPAGRRRRRRPPQPGRPRPPRDDGRRDPGADDRRHPHPPGAARRPGPDDARRCEGALSRGVTTTELRASPTAWRRRGRAGPAALLGMLGESDDDRLPSRLVPSGGGTRPRPVRGPPRRRVPGRRRRARPRRSDPTASESPTAARR